MNKKIKAHQVRRRFDDMSMKKICLSIPQEVFDEAFDNFLDNNPERYYSFSHYVTCALISFMRNLEYDNH